MELRMFCKVLLIHLLIGFVSSARIHRALNEDLQEDIKRLNISRDARLFLTRTNLKSSDNGEDGDKTGIKLQSTKNKADSKDHISKEKLEKTDPLGDLKDAVRLSEQKPPKAKTQTEEHDGNVNDKDMVFTQTKRKEGQEHEQFNYEKEENKQQLKPYKKTKEQYNTVEQNKIKIKHKDKDELREEMPEKVQEIKEYTVGNKTTLEPVRGGKGTHEIPLQETSAILIQHEKETIKSKTMVSDKNDAVHVKEKNRTHSFHHNYVNERKHKPKFKTPGAFRSKGITENPRIRKLPVTEDSGKLTELEMLVSKQPLVTIINRKPAHGPDTLRKTTFPRSSRKMESVSSVGKLNIHTELSKPSQNQETVGSRTTFQLKVTERIQSSNKQEKVSEKTSVDRYTTSTITLKTKNSDRLSFENTEGVLNSENAVSNTNEHTAVEITSINKRTSIQNPLGKSDINNFHPENNFAENIDDISLSGSPCQGTNDPSKMYTGSALVAAAVGGVFIGAFAVLFLVHLRQKCKKLVNGDYRRVPMEYDFELNPRFKSH